MAKSNQKSMTTEEAGRKGGEKVAEEYSQEHFENIGQKGGETTSEKYGGEHYEEIGQKGGRSSGKDSNRNS